MSKSLPCLKFHPTTENGVFIPKLTDLCGAWRSRAQSRGDEQIAFSFMELSCFESTKTHLHFGSKEFLASAATLQQRTAASAELCFPFSSPAALTENLLPVELCPICSRNSPFPPGNSFHPPWDGSRCLWKEFFCWLWDISFQEQEPSRRVPGSGELQPQPRLLCSAH